MVGATSSLERRPTAAYDQVLFTHTPTARNLYDSGDAAPERSARRTYPHTSADEWLRLTPEERADRIMETTQAQLSGIGVTLGRTIDGIMRSQDNMLRQILGDEFVDDLDLLERGESHRSPTAGAQPRERRALPPASTDEDVIEAEVIEPHGERVPAAASFDPLAFDEERDRRDREEFYSLTDPDAARKKLTEMRDRERDRVRARIRAGLPGLGLDSSSSKRP